MTLAVNERLEVERAELLAQRIVNVRPDGHVGTREQGAQLVVGDGLVELHERTDGVEQRERRVPRVHRFVGQCETDAERSERDDEPGGRRDRVALDARTPRGGRLGPHEQDHD